MTVPSFHFLWNQSHTSIDYDEMSYYSSLVSNYSLTSKMKPTNSRISGKERKASIIEAATVLFAAKGFNGTKTRQIAEKAGVSEALVFKHFPTKNHLYAAILAEKSPVPRLLSEIKDLADRREDVQVFSLIANSVIVHGVPESKLMRLLLFSALEGHKLSDMFFQNHVRVFHEFLAKYIDRRIHDGAFRKCDSLLVARSFMGILIEHRLLTLLFRLPVSNSPEDMVETFVSLFLDGIRKDSVTKRKSRKRILVRKRIGPTSHPRK